MAFALSTRPGSISTSVIDDPLVNETPQNNVGTGATVFFSVMINNTANPAQDVYLKLWNHASPTVGTTAAHTVLKGPAGKRRSYSIPEGIAFGTALSYACVTSAATAGDDAPTNDVSIIMQIT